MVASSSRKKLSSIAKGEGLTMISNDWKLTASDLSVLAEDKSIEEKITEVMDLSEDEMALITGGFGGCGGFGGFGSCGFGGSCGSYVTIIISTGYGGFGSCGYGGFGYG